MNLNDCFYDLSIKDIILFILIVLTIYLIFKSFKKSIKNKDDIINTKLTQENFTTHNVNEKFGVTSTTSTNNIITNIDIEKAINLYYNDDINTLLYLNSIAFMILNHTKNTTDNLILPSNIQVNDMNVYNSVTVNGNIILEPNTNLFFNNIYNFLPSKVIMPWTSFIIPKGWVVCDGTNDTPNLTFRFLMHDSTYNYGYIGYKKTNDRFDKGYYFGSDVENLSIYETMHRHGGLGPTEKKHPELIAMLEPSREHEFIDYDQGETYLPTSYSGSSIPHNNMPPYMVLLYIMKQ